VEKERIIMELYIPKGGDIFSICIKKHYQSIAFLFPVFRWSSVAGFTIRLPRIHPTMTAMKRFYQLVKLDQIPGVICNKCIKYPIEFHTSIREGNELQYSGYERTIIDKLLRRT